MRYITTTDTNITFTDVDGKVKIVPKNRVYTHFNVDTVTFLLIERYDNEGICLFSTKASDLQINGETYTYQELLDGEGISDLFSPTGLSFEVVEELPQSGEEGTIYFVPNDHDTYTEYIWIAEEEKWEAIGDSDIDLSNYYTKTQTDNTFATQTVVNQEIAARIQGDADINTALTAKADKSDTYTKTQVDTALSAKANAADVYTKTQVDTALNGKQDTLEFYSETVDEQTGEQIAQIENTHSDGEGVTKTSVVQTFVDSDNISVDMYAQQEANTQEENYSKSADVYVDAVNGVEITYQNDDNIQETGIDSHIFVKGNGIEISASETENGEGVGFDLLVTPDGVTVNGDNVLTDNDAYTKTQVDTALSAKQDTLTAGTGIDITNNVISATGGTQVQSDWNQSDSSAVDYIKNKPTIPDTSDFVTKAEYNPKEVAIANALTQLNENKADKTELPDTSTFATKTELNGKQDTLTAGQNITIQNNVISATGGGGASYQFYSEIDEEQEEGTTINRHKDGVIQIADEGGTIDSGMGTFFTQVEEDGSISYTQVNSSMYADKDDGETVNGSTIDVEYNYVSITVSEDGEDNGTQYSKNTDFIVNPDSLTVEVNVDGVTETQLELNDSGLSINGNDVLTTVEYDEIMDIIGDIQLILQGI